MLYDTAFVLEVADTLEELYAMPLHVLTERVSKLKMRERHQAQGVAMLSLLQYSANRGEKGKKLTIEHFLPWSDETKTGGALQGQFSASELVAIESLLDSKLISGVVNVEIRYALGMI
jgi:hypothetical protein